MANETVQQTVVRAVQQAYDAWAAEHPSLAAVIDRIELTNHAVESLRDTEDYRKAVAAYQTGMNELDLINKLIDLAGPIIQSILAG